jgi:hypothetical protein
MAKAMAIVKLERGKSYSLTEKKPPIAEATATGGIVFLSDTLG